MKVGFGATFSSTGKFSSLTFSDPEDDAASDALYCKAISPITTALVICVCVKVALTVSTTDALRPGWCIGAWEIVGWATLLKE